MLTMLSIRVGILGFGVEAYTRQHSVSLDTLPVSTIAPPRPRKQYPWKTGLVLVTSALLLYIGLFARNKPEDTQSISKMAGNPQSFVDGLIKSEKVVIFSKS